MFTKHVRVALLNRDQVPPLIIQGLNKKAKLILDQHSYSEALREHGPWSKVVHYIGNGGLPRMT